MKIRDISYALVAVVILMASDAFCYENNFREEFNAATYGSSIFNRRYIGVYVDRSKTIDQMLVSEAACGPTAILNAMQFGNSDIRSIYRAFPGDDNQSKLGFIVNKYGQRTSYEHSFGSRIQNKGILPEDLLDIFNEILMANRMTGVHGEYVVRKENEPLSDFLKRLHEKLYSSLNKGVPVVAHIRSFGAKRNNENNRMYWYSLSSHYITITKIPERLLDYERGFTFEFIDPYGGRVESGYMGVELNRGFNAKTGDRDNYRWIKGRSFLLVKAPSLNLKTSRQKWHNRTIMTLSYVIGRIN